MGGDIVTHTFFLCREKSNQDLCWGFFFFFLQLSISCISASFNIFSYITYACERGGGGCFFHPPYSLPRVLTFLAWVDSHSSLFSSPLLSSSPLYPLILLPPSCCFHLIGAVFLPPHSLSASTSLQPSKDTRVAVRIWPDSQMCRVCATVRAKHLLKAALTVH